MKASKDFWEKIGLGVMAAIALVMVFGVVGAFITGSAGAWVFMMVVPLVLIVLAGILLAIDMKLQEGCKSHYLVSLAREKVIMRTIWRAFVAAFFIPIIVVGRAGDVTQARILFGLSLPLHVFVWIMLGRPSLYDFLFGQ